MHRLRPSGAHRVTAPRPAAVIVLAAGEGTRMKSATPKVLHAIGGRTLLGHAVAAARGVDPEHLVIVVRHGRDLVAAHIEDVDPGAVIVDQDEVKGTGRAVECALAALPAGVLGTVLVTSGDVPLLSAQTLRGLLKAHVASGSAATVITATLPDPSGYGRILRGADGLVAGVIEQKDATDAQREIAEINSGLYAFDAAVLRRALTQVGTDNVQGERYLTDVLGIIASQGLRVSAHLIQDLWETEGVNDRVQLARLGAEFNRRIGEHTNIGASSVFVNYDGVNKMHTTIGSHCRTGSDNMFVAPVSVGDGAYTGAGTVVRQDVPPGALAINIAPQRNLLGWVLKKRPGTASARADAAAGQDSAAASQDSAAASQDSTIAPETSIIVPEGNA